jgi:phenylacetate-CoA ligase
VRALLLQGLRDTDVVHSLYGFGTVNAGHYIREAITHFTGALLVTASTGSVTPSRQQVSMMKHFGATVLVGFADYIRKLAEVARAEGMEPGKDIPIRLICSSIGGESRDFISGAWGGARVFDIYGVGDTGIISAEAPELDGLYIWEDAHIVELVDPETLAPVPEGRVGNICVTSLFKDDIFPNIRFNTNDLSALATDESRSGWTLRRMRGFLGRSDGMVKLRGINVYPTAVGEILRREPGTNGEFLCEVQRVGQRDEMTVFIEVTAPREQRTNLAERLEQILRDKIGVGMNIDLVDPGVLADRTGLEARQKAIRLIDARPFDSSRR